MSGSPAAEGPQSRTFPGSADQVPQARRYLAALLSGHTSAEDAALCLTELVSNAILHSRSGQPGGTFTVRVAAGSAVCVEVHDQGGPWVTHPDPDGARGRGLVIVASLADDSGITGGRSGRTAWFTMKGRP